MRAKSAEMPSIMFTKFLRLRSFIDHMEKGCYLYKRENQAASRRYFFQVDPVKKSIIWRESAHISHCAGQVFLCNIQEITTGSIEVHNEDINESDTRRITNSPYLCIVTRRRSVQLIFPCWREWEAWHAGLKFMTGLSTNTKLSHIMSSNNSAVAKSSIRTVWSASCDRDISQKYYKQDRIQPASIVSDSTDDDISDIESGELEYLVKEDVPAIVMHDEPSTEDEDDENCDIKSTEEKKIEQIGETNLNEIKNNLEPMSEIEEVDICKSRSPTVNSKSDIMMSPSWETISEGGDFEEFSTCAPQDYVTSLVKNCDVPVNDILDKINEKDVENIYLNIVAPLREAYFVQCHLNDVLLKEIRSLQKKYRFQAEELQRLKALQDDNLSVNQTL